MKVTAYKDVTLHQLRSFCATARHGSLTAAAEALELAQPTVWKQVHTLEKMFDAKLVEPHARGCRLTEDGEVLHLLLEPSVAHLDLAELRTRFNEARGRTNIHIAVAGQSRQLADDLPPVIAAFVPHWPRVRFTLQQANAEEVAVLVESGECTLGFTTDLENQSRYPHLSFERWYDLAVLLIAPRDHPLAQRRSVRAADLKPYPLINAKMSLHDTQAHGALLKLGLYLTEPRWVEARNAATTYRCVEAGLGIALVPGLWPRPPHPHLHERVLRRDFGPIPMYLVQRRGVYQHAAVRAFAEEVRLQLAVRRKKKER